MQTCLFYIEIINDNKGRKNIIVICKDLVFFCTFCEIFKNTLFMEHLQWQLLFFQKMLFSVLVFSDENNIAKSALGNCSNRLQYSLETCNCFLKSLHYRCFPVNSAKCFRISFLQNSSGQLLLGFFIHFTVSPPDELIETSLFLFLDMFYQGIQTS